MTQRFTVSMILPIEPNALYAAWLNSRVHSAFTGGVAKISARPGGAFTAWDGYIYGKTLELHPHDRILQSWRTTDFQSGDEDSLLEILIEKHSRGCKLSLTHSRVPKGRVQEFKKGWKEYYFTPMKEYFSKQKA